MYNFRSLLRTHKTVGATVKADALAYLFTVVSFQRGTIPSVLYMSLPLIFVFPLLTRSYGFP